MGLVQINEVLIYKGQLEINNILYVTRVQCGALGNCQEGLWVLARHGAGLLAVKQNSSLYLTDNCANFKNHWNCFM